MRVGRHRGRVLWAVLAPAVLAGVWPAGVTRAAEAPEATSRQEVEEIIPEYIKNHPEILNEAVLRQVIEVIVRDYLRSHPEIFNDATTRQAIEAIVRDYLRSQPEIVQDAQRTLQVRTREAERERAREAVKAHREQLLADTASPVVGNPGGDVTVVQFTDYRCASCWGVAPAVRKLLQEDPNVRLVYKELPILGPDSALAARAALAAQGQGKFGVFHDALMAANGPFTVPVILQIAQTAGLDAARLQADMEAPEIHAAIERNRSLADALGIRGTPAFVIGTELVPGPVDLQALKALVSQARAK